VVLPFKRRHLENVAGGKNNYNDLFLDFTLGRKPDVLYNGKEYNRKEWVRND
jgi:hypothetical protein